MYHAYNSSIILAKYSFYIHICILLTSSYILVVVVVFRRGSILFVFELTCSFYQLMFWKFQMPAKSNSWYPCPHFGAPQRQPHISLHSPTVCLKKYLKQCYCFPHLTPLPHPGTLNGQYCSCGQRTPQHLSYGAEKQVKNTCVIQSCGRLRLHCRRD